MNQSKGKMMKKIIGLITAILIIGGAAWVAKGPQSSLSSKTAPTEDDIIKIGVILPLSGNNAVIGKHLKEGLDLVRNYNHYGKDFEFIYEDDQMDAAKTNLIAQKLATADKVDAIITYASQPAGIVAPIAAKHNVLQFANSSDTAFTRYKGNYAFAPSPQEEMLMLLQTVKKRGYNKIALITAVEAYSNLAEKNIKELAPKEEIEIVYEAKVNPSDRDFKMLIVEAESKNPDVYILQTWEPVLDILVKQLRQTAPKKPFTAAYAFFLSNNPKLFEGQFCLNIGSRNREYEKFFYQHYKKYPGQMSAVGYAEADLLLKTLSSIDHREQFYDRLKEITGRDKTVLGRLKVNERQINYQPILQEFRGGKPVTIAE